MSENLRKNILIELARYTGKEVAASFIKHTSDIITNIERFHNLITGIYKPVWSNYALSVVMKLGSPYEHKDDVIYLEDGRWLMTYSPRSGGLEHSDNRSLIKCMEDKIPICVFKQITDKRNKKYGSTYKVLGLGLITGYEEKSDVFIVESADQSILDDVTSVIPEEETRYEVKLYANLTNEFQPFVREGKANYTINSAKRDKVFRQIILKEYDFTCAVCEMKFLLGNLFEVTASHIVSKKDNGTDDPRNGLALCRTHHWAFDVGIFSLSDNYEMLLSPSLVKAETRNFDLLNLKGKRISLPKHKQIWPHPKSLLWHRNEILLK
jgi:hypothetical protein